MSNDFSLSQWAMQVLPQQYRNDLLILFLDGIGQIIPQNIVKMLTKYNRYYLLKFSSNPIYDAPKNIIQWKFNLILSEMDDIPVGFSVLTIIVNPLRTSCKGYLQLDCNNQLLNVELIQIKAIISNITKLVEYLASDTFNKIGVANQSQANQFQSSMLPMGQSQYQSINQYQQPSVQTVNQYQFPAFQSNNQQPHTQNPDTIAQEKVEFKQDIKSNSPLGIYSQNIKSSSVEKKEENPSMPPPQQKENDEVIKIDTLVGNSSKKNDNEAPSQFDINTSIKIPKIPSIRASTTRVPITNSKKTTTSDGNKSKKTKE